MKSNKRHFTTALAITGSLILIFCVYKTRELYFTNESAPQNDLIVLKPINDVSKPSRLSVPKLKILKNTSIDPKKLSPKSEEASDLDQTSNTNLSSDQQIMTHKYLIKVLSQQQSFLRRCYENHLRANTIPVVKGSVVVEFIVLPFGEIRDVVIKDSSFKKDPTFENCIQTVFLRTQVKKFSGEKFLITFPLEFE